MALIVMILSLTGFGVMCAGLLAGVFAFANAGEAQKALEGLSNEQKKKKES